MVSPFWPCWVMRAQCSGCKWGFPIGNRSPLQVPLRSTTWTSTGGVYPRSPPSPRSPTYMGLRTPAARPLSSPCSPRSPPARPQALTELRSPSGLFPGIPLTHGPPHGCLRTPRPRPRAPWACGYGFGVAVVPWGGGRGAGCHGRARGRPAGCPGELRDGC